MEQLTQRHRAGFALVLPVEQVLPAGLLGHRELQGGLASGPQEAAQEL